MKTNRRWKTVALVAASLALGVVIAATPATAHVGGWLHNWNQHIKPKADARYMPGGMLPAGKTIRGAYDMGGTAAAANALATAELSFGYRPFKAQPTPHFIKLGDPAVPACPGTSADPQAAPGHLCIYERFSLNAGNRSMTGPSGDNSAWRFGAGLFIRSVASGTFYSIGTWAATSGPAGPSPRASALDPVVHGLEP